MQDLEFASVIVQKLNIILITSPELADFRKRLKSLETRVSSPLLHSFYALKSNDNIKTDRCSSPHYIDPGVTMPWPSSPFAFLRKHTSMRLIYFPFCTVESVFKISFMIDILPQCGSGNNRTDVGPSRQAGSVDRIASLHM